MVRPIQTGGGSVAVEPRMSGVDYGHLLVIGAPVAWERREARVQLTHEAALDLHFRLGVLIQEGRL